MELIVRFKVRDEELVVFVDNFNIRRADASIGVMEDYVEEFEIMEIWDDIDQVVSGDRCAYLCGILHEAESFSKAIMKRIIEYIDEDEIEDLVS